MIDMADFSITESMDIEASACTDLLWNLTVVLHHDPIMVGRRVAMERGRDLLLGRESEAFGPRGLYSRRISRRQALLQVDESDILSLTDAASHNGTLVNGRVESRVTLSAGDVLEFGPVMLLVHRQPLAASPSPTDPTSGEHSWAMTQCRGDAARVAVLPDPLWIAGERGVGKEQLAQWIHQRSGRASLVTLDLTTLGSSEARTHLLGDESHASVLNSAEGGTLLLKHLERAEAEVQLLLAAILDQCRPGAANRRDVRVLATIVDAPGSRMRESTLLPELVDRMGLLRLTVPPLRERLAGFPKCLRAILAEQNHAEAEIDASLMLALLRHPWPGNIRELEQVVRAACFAAGDHGKLALTPELSEALNASMLPDATGADQVRMGRDGSWAQVGGRRIDLTTRPSLMRVFKALITRWDQGQRAPAGPLELFEAGWPGETAAESSARARVYVAISTLRKMGLRRVIIRQGSGYVILDNDQISVVDEAPSASI